MSYLQSAARVIGFFLSVACIVGATLLVLRGILEAPSWTGSQNSDLLAGAFLFAMGLGLLWIMSRSKVENPHALAGDPEPIPPLSEESIADLRARVQEASKTPRRDSAKSHQETVIN